MSTYDPALYWADDAYYVAQWLPAVAADDPRVVAYANGRLDDATRRAVADLQWGSYHQDEARETEGERVCIRRTLYECPFYRKIERWDVPNTIQGFRLVAPGGPIVLVLRRIMANGERLFGALHNDTLYIVRAISRSNYR